MAQKSHRHFPAEEKSKCYTEIHLTTTSKTTLYETAKDSQINVLYFVIEIMMSLQNALN